ncbi:MAG: protein-L-isoaspartate(D-aspartate) O-methyltransferase [Candidatus Aenigmarchaeota archaeon]|nr:protein-L-isoaspartate(D-aspartate) O-methyltransferase [Candidatus Aenigmarchaeota archaeon]
MSYENRKLVSDIKQKGYLKSKELEQAILDLPREKFVSGSLKRFAYEDIPISIGHRQTVSQPSTVVIMTEALDVKKTDKILEIGTGSGWQSSILSKLTKKNVYTIERIHELAESAKSNIKEMGIKNVKVIEGDGSKGLKKYALYDKIIVTAASPELPKPLLDQLKIGGKMVIPLGDYYSQEMFVVTKRGKGKYDKVSIGFFNFVPLLGKYGFEERK